MHVFYTWLPTWIALLIMIAPWVASLARLGYAGCARTYLAFNHMEPARDV
jgi:hypothetical protein